MYFLNFGESTLDHELRMHVRDLGDRNPVLDEVNRFINREFKKQHINISFRQMEVYLKNLQGQEYKWSRLSRKPKPLFRHPPANRGKSHRLSNSTKRAIPSRMLGHSAGDGR